MSMELVDEFNAGFDENQFPAEFLQKYEPLECLASNEFGETILVKDRATHERCIAKCYTQLTPPFHPAEGEVLKRLHHQGLPVFIDEFENEHVHCIVRTYLPGQSLEEYSHENKISNELAVSIVSQLCDILSYLHSQNPPIIHRDIKPQNIIINEQGEIALIDFGISRTYDEASREDTLNLGTKHYAAPEQYGFSQTDSRTDIFSLGVLLQWLLTGKAVPGKESKPIENRRLARVISKCTEFAPGDRYRNTAQVKKALNARPNNLPVWVLSSALCLLLAGIFFLFLSGHLTFSGFGKTTFKEPLIEEAVRLTLGKSTKEEITEEDLSKVSVLYVFGDHAAANQESFDEFSDGFAHNDGSIHRGDIESLTDLEKLQNLRELHIVYQNVSDLQPLSKLVFLDSLDLRHNPIEDISPLSNLKSLSSLNLFDTHVSDLTSLSVCSHLTTLDIGATQVESIAALDGVSSIRSLVVRKAPLQSLENIGTHPFLEEVYLSDTQLMDLSPLLNLPNLKTVEVSENMKSLLGGLADRYDILVIYQ